MIRKHDCPFDTGAGYCPVCIAEAIDSQFRPKPKESSTWPALIFGALLAAVIVLSLYFPN